MLSSRGFEGHPRDHSQTSWLMLGRFDFTRPRKLNISTFVVLLDARHSNKTLPFCPPSNSHITGEGRKTGLRQIVLWVYGDVAKKRNIPTKHPNSCLNMYRKLQSLRWEHLGISGSIWEHLAASGSIWEHLTASGSILQHLAASGSIW